MSLAVDLGTYAKTTDLLYVSSEPDLPVPIQCEQKALPRYLPDYDHVLCGAHGDLGPKVWKSLWKTLG